VRRLVLKKKKRKKKERNKEKRTTPDLLGHAQGSGSPSEKKKVPERRG
jgi:hypothetical protein